MVRLSDTQMRSPSVLAPFCLDRSRRRRSRRRGKRRRGRRSRRRGGRRSRSRRECVSGRHVMGPPRANGCGALHLVVPFKEYFDVFSDDNDGHQQLHELLSHLGFESGDLYASNLHIPHVPARHEAANPVTLQNQKTEVPVRRWWPKLGLQQ